MKTRSSCKSQLSAMRKALLASVLGLALVHRIVTEHGCSISVASDPSGTTFTLSLPSPSRAKKDSPEG